jgi:ubiquinone/menaquinone biosynthesis C-methylase UbiE
VTRSVSIGSLLMCAMLCPAQVAKKANEAYQTKEGREGIAKTLADPHRDERQHPRDIIDAMKLKKGQTAVDLGTGVGYMLPYLSHAVGPTGAVIGEDIAQDFIDKAKLRASSVDLKNVKFILGTERDPMLPADTADAILILDVYHHFDYPATMLGHIRDCLVSDGRLYIVDFYKRPDAMPNGRAMEHIRLDQEDVIHEVEDGGFRLVSVADLIPRSQYIAVFAKK